MENTILTKTHIKLGAKMGPFAGYNMPIVYSSIKEEHMAVRKAAGMFDVSHMGEFIVRGPQAFDLVQYVTSNDVSKLKVGQAQYSCLPNEDGGIVDDLIIYKLPNNAPTPYDGEYLLVVNASNIEKDYSWICSHDQFDVEVKDISVYMGLLAVQGPKATQILQRLTETDLGAIPFYHFAIGSMAGMEDLIISATGYTGSGGFEIYAKNGDIPALWDKIMEEGKEEGLVPAGLGARDTLRLEMGYCLYGNDINDETSPIEAGLSWITKVKKGDFNSRDIFASQKKEGTLKRLVAFKVEDRRVPRHGYPILNENEEEIGIVTSGTLSPCLEVPIGMGYVNAEYKSNDTNILVKAGRKTLRARICKLPFYAPGN